MVRLFCCAYKDQTDTVMIHNALRASGENITELHIVFLLHRLQVKNIDQGLTKCSWQEARQISLSQNQIKQG
jgi:hypothetical protein